ncbi:hypothetical protein C0992_007222 [Termitomyces sp. T32_za158]|nr:hypothetical protein C0992_007222 [Termitomyces sp. T32_za158]
MSQKLHAADALLIHASDSSHEDHHRHHGSSLQRYEEGRDDFLQTQRIGSKPDLIQQRVRLAEQYRTCKPINSAFIQAGWYDTKVQMAPVIIETKNESKDGSQNSPTSNPAPLLSPLTEVDSFLPPLDITVSTIRPTVTAMFPSLKRKRTVLDFVAVPNRTYKEIVPDIQLVSGDLSTLSKVVNKMSASLAKISEESQRKPTAVRKLPRFKKNSPTMRQASDDVSSSSSSAYPRSTPSDGSDRTQVIDSLVNENHPVALNVDPPEQTQSINSDVLQAAQTPPPTDSSVLEKAVKGIADAIRTITQSHHGPSQSPDPISTSATALEKFTNHHSQSMILPQTPGWFQENYFPLFQPYPMSSLRKWPKSGYQQSSHYPDGHIYGLTHFEGKNAS